MAKNKTFTGGRQSARTSQINKNAYFQLARMIRNAGKENKKHGTQPKSESPELHGG